MAGQYRNIKKIKASIEKWRNTVISPEGRWEGNGMHIDEIASLKKVKREDWINTSFFVLDLIINMKPIDSLILLLHIGPQLSGK